MPVRAPAIRMFARLRPQIINGRQKFRPRCSLKRADNCCIFMAYLAPADMWALSRRTVLYSVLRSCAADNAFHLLANFYYPPHPKI